MPKSNHNKNKKKTKKNIVLWRNIKPHTNTERRTMKKKFKSKCFIEPKTLKYPICNKYSGKVECKGIYAAQYYVNLNKSRKLKPLKKYKTLGKKIESLKRKYQCGKYSR